MERFLYETKPYAITVLGGVTIVNPAPWIGVVSGTMLMTIGIILIYLRRKARE